MFRLMRVCSSAVILTLGLFLAQAGCTTDEMVGEEIGRDGSASTSVENAPAPAATLPLAGRSEVDLVNEMVLHRSNYAQYLRAMATFYSENGYEQKANWARAELKDVQKIKAGSYVTDGEVPIAGAEEAGVAPISLVNRNEPDLVEDLVLHRNMYGSYLRALVTFYSENGFDEKANIARLELKGLQGVKPYNYILDAELPLSTLRPSESIAEADKLFEEGEKLMDQGGHHVIIFYHDATMKKAVNKFKELINKYPTSDKIDDAAYFIAEIHKEYNQERDNMLALEWYKRAIEWNPKLPYPAWSHTAHILDFRMHEREKALEWYYKVLENEADQTGWRFAGNVKVAHKRIAELTAEKTRYAPAEPTPEVQPAAVAPTN